MFIRCKIWYSWPFSPWVSCKLDVLWKVEVIHSMNPDQMPKPLQQVNSSTDKTHFRYLNQLCLFTPPMVWWYLMELFALDSPTSSLQQSGTMLALLLFPHQSTCWSHAPFYLHFTCSRATTQDRPTWTPSLWAATPSQPRGSDHGLRLGDTHSHPSRFTLECKLPQCMLKVTAWWSQTTSEAHHLQRAEKQFWGPQTRRSPPPGCA